MCKCLETGGDEFDNTVLTICGHRPGCAEFKIDKYSFAANVHAEAQKMADRIIEPERLRLKLLSENYEPKKPKVSKITESRVQCRLFRRLQEKGHPLIAPNIDIFYTGEMDVCSVMKSGMVNEYEIKLSRADFKKDFKKAHKHPVYLKISKGIFKETVPVFGGKSMRGVVYTSPNFFYFVTPKNLIKPEELPEYAGLIEFDPENIYDIRTVSKAKQLHREPITNEHRASIKNKLMWRCWTAKEKVESLQEIN